MHFCTKLSAFSVLIYYLRINTFPQEAQREKGGEAGSAESAIWGNRKIDAENLQRNLFHDQKAVMKAE